MSGDRDQDNRLWKESIANRPKHWVRLVTSCNSRCLFCLDMDTPRNVTLSQAEIHADLQQGRDQQDAWKVILSGGEATLHPHFSAIVRHAHAIGYGRVQCVTNGFRFGADGAFFRECVDAGLDEITFSLHGHTEALHDHLTQHKGAFNNIVKAIVRALRDGRVIVNVDIVINKQNVGHLDKIMQLAISLGVTEFDLLHVIPQAEAYRQRDKLFYNPREFLPLLHKVFRLDRHPRFVVWTNRFPISYLEGMEDLIQDPHKMLDEINGRRFHVRKYLDRGVPLECRQPERCMHCFIEPFCTTMDRTIARQNDASWQVWWVGTAPDSWPQPLPYGCTMVGLDLAAGPLPPLPDLPAGAGVYLRGAPLDLPALPPHSLLLADTPDQLDAWLPSPESAAQPGPQIEVWLNQQTGPWLLAQRARVSAALHRLRLHQPSHEHLAQAVAHDLRDPAAFFCALDLPLRVSGLPLCLTPGAVKLPAIALLDAALFDPDSGRLDIQSLARYHVREGYSAKSVRCEDCRLHTRCDGLHVNLVRDQGLGLLSPFQQGAWADAAEAQALALHPQPIARVANGSPAQPTAPSLPGFPEAPEPPQDPLAIEQQRRMARRAELLERARAELAASD